MRMWFVSVSRRGRHQINLVHGVVEHETRVLDGRGVRRVAQALRYVRGTVSSCLAHSNVTLGRWSEMLPPTLVARAPRLKLRLLQAVAVRD